MAVEMKECVLTTQIGNFSRDTPSILHDCYQPRLNPKSRVLRDSTPLPPYGPNSSPSGSRSFEPLVDNPADRLPFELSFLKLESTILHAPTVPLDRRGSPQPGEDNSFSSPIFTISTTNGEQMSNTIKRTSSFFNALKRLPPVGLLSRARRVPTPHMASGAIYF